MPDIEPRFKALGIRSTEKNHWDGSDRYTAPAIYDPSTGTYLADSTLIAQYLDETYPDTPAIFPKNTIGLQLAFEDAYISSISSLFPFGFLTIWKVLNSESKGHLRSALEKMIGATLEDAYPTGERAVEQWALLKAGLGKVDAWYAKTDTVGPFALGDLISWSDIVVASFTISIRVCFGEESQQWKDVSSWHDGRWADLIKAFEKYATIA